MQNPVAMNNDSREIKELTMTGNEDRRNATPEELLEAVVWYFRQDNDDAQAKKAEEVIQILRAGFQLAQPGGWVHVAPHWLRKSKRPVTEYRCPYCGSPLTDDDTTRDREALYCAECGERVEFADILVTIGDFLAPDRYPVPQATKEV